MFCCFYCCWDGCTFVFVLFLSDYFVVLFGLFVGLLCIVCCTIWFYVVCLVVWLVQLRWVCVWCRLLLFTVYCVVWLDLLFILA